MGDLSAADQVNNSYIAQNLKETTRPSYHAPDQTEGLQARNDCCLVIVIIVVVTKEMVIQYRK